MRLIDADALGVGEANRGVFTVPEYADGWNSAIKMIKNAPTVDVELVRHGHWIEDDGFQICSECGEEHCWDEYRASYCEDCGAKMDGGGEK